MYKDIAMNKFISLQDQLKDILYEQCLLKDLTASLSADLVPL